MDLIHHYYLPGTLQTEFKCWSSEITRHTGHQNLGEQFLELRMLLDEGTDKISILPISSLNTKITLMEYIDLFRLS